MKHALLRTLPGRAIVIGAAMKLVVYAVGLAAGSVPAWLGVADTVAGLAIAAGGGYFLWQLAPLAKRRLLWRVRRKLILSYIFIGFVPATLLVVFFMLGGLLLFFNVSSYLVQSEVRAIGDQAAYLAATTARELPGGGRDGLAVVERRRDGAQAAFPGASIIVVSLNRQEGTAGRGSCAAPPAVPAWIGCGGFSGPFPEADLRRSGGTRASGGGGQLVVRAVGFPDSAAPDYAVIVDLPVDATVKERVRHDTGVELESVNTLDLGGGTDPAPNPEVVSDGAQAATGADRSQSVVSSGGRLGWVTFLGYREWSSGKPGTMVVSTRLSITDIYDRISAAQGLVGNRSFGHALLLVLLVVVGGLFLVIVAVALVAGFALAKSITGSVHELFVGTERVRRLDFSHRIAVTSRDQLGELAGSFNDMTSSIETLLVQQKEKERLEEELRIAHEIQMSLLPQGPLVMPGLSVTALCVPAREVGGDYYDFLRLDTHRVGVLIADVSGKGTSAALYMAELKGLVLSLSRTYTSPRELLIVANEILASHLDVRSFITMTYAVLDMQARTMTYARAGHTPLIAVPGPGAGSRRAHILMPDGLVVGLKVDNGETFERLLEEQTIPLGPGDLYLFFTDGISEAMNAQDDCFGEARLGALLEAHADRTSEEIRERVLRDIAAFVGDAPQHDDMTMILVKVDDPVARDEAAAVAVEAGAARVV